MWIFLLTCNVWIACHRKTATCTCVTYVTFFYLLILFYLLWKTWTCMHGAAIGFLSWQYPTTSCRSDSNQGCRSPLSSTLVKKYKWSIYLSWCVPTGSEFCLMLDGKSSFCPFCFCFCCIALNSRLLSFVSVREWLTNINDELFFFFCHDNHANSFFSLFQCQSFTFTFTFTCFWI